MRQAEQLATALLAIKDPPITRVYSSPFYRCLQTLQPFVEKSGLEEVRGDNGIGYDSLPNSFYRLSEGVSKSALTELGLAVNGTASLDLRTHRPPPRPSSTPFSNHTTPSTNPA